MLKQLRLICVILCLLALSIALYSQEEEDYDTVVPDTAAVALQDTTGVISMASDFLNLLINNDNSAENDIAWESLVINGEDYTEDYWDAYDWEEEDIFMEDTVKSLSTMIQIVGETPDKFVDWSIAPRDNFFFVKCHNTYKNVDLLLAKVSPEIIYISEINIADRVK
jgi:hypothetical protein